MSWPHCTRLLMLAVVGHLFKVATQRPRLILTAVMMLKCCISLRSIQLIIMALSLSSPVNKVNSFSVSNCEQMFIGNKSLSNVKRNDVPGLRSVFVLHYQTNKGPHCGSTSPCRPFLLGFILRPRVWKMTGCDFRPPGWLILSDRPLACISETPEVTWGKAGCHCSMLAEGGMSNLRKQSDAYELWSGSYCLLFSSVGKWNSTCVWKNLVLSDFYLSKHQNILKVK